MRVGLTKDFQRNHAGELDFEVGLRTARSLMFDDVDAIEEHRLIASCHDQSDSGSNSAAGNPRSAPIPANRLVRHVRFNLTLLTPMLAAKPAHAHILQAP